MRLLGDPSFEFFSGTGGPTLPLPNSLIDAPALSNSLSFALRRILKKPSVPLDEDLLLVGVRSFQAATIFLTELNAEDPPNLLLGDPMDVGGGERKDDLVGETGLEPVDPPNWDSGGIDGKVLDRA